MSGKYNLIQISVFVLTLYLFTYLLQWFQAISKKMHRKIWNTILLLAFLISGLIGLFSMIKINYKLEIPLYDKLLELHVEAGIVMLVTGFIHFILHFSYFTGLFKKDSKRKNISLFTGDVITLLLERNIKILLIFTGFVSTGSQIIFLREFFTIFYGNELIFGLILSLWLLFSGIGAYTFKNVENTISIKKIPYLLWFLSWILIVFIILLYPSKELFFVHGQQVQFIKILAFSSIILFVPCFLSGYLFSFLTTLLSWKDNKIGVSFGYETFGGIIGGIIVNFILVFFLNSFQILGIILLITHSFLIILFKKEKVLKLILTITLITFTFLFIPDSQKTIRQFLFKPASIINTQSIPSGNIDVTFYENQYNLYHNNFLLDFSHDNAYNEEKVHYTMLLHPQPLSVLIISNGYSGFIEEINKYKTVQEIDIIEPDRWSSVAIQKMFDFDTLGIIPEFIHKDVRTYLRTTEKKYDVVLINVPEPLTIYYNRFCSLEFFKMINNVLKQGAIISYKYSAGINYLNDNERKVMGLIYNSLSIVFDYIKIVPVNSYYFIASNTEIILDYENRFLNYNFENEYVNLFYVNNNLINQRADFTENDIQDVAGKNYDLDPKAFLYQIRVYMDYHNLGYKTIGIILVLLFIVMMLKQNSIRKSLFLSSFTGISIEILTIILVQIYIGNAFYIAGVIITLFMLFIGGGALFHQKIFKYNTKKLYNFIVLIYGLACIGFFLIIILLNTVIQSNLLMYLLLLLIVFISGFLNGTIFSKATIIEQSTININVSKNYSADMFGASLGAIITTIYFIPIFGIMSTLVGFGVILIFVSCINILFNLK